TVTYAAWSPDGRRVATASTDKSAQVWDVGELEKAPQGSATSSEARPVILKEHTDAVTFVAFRPDGQYVATASDDGTARLWPVEGGTPLELSGHEAPVRSAAWSPDGSRVLPVAGARDKGVARSALTARIWRATRLSSLPRPRAGFFHTAFLASGGD